jgi:hypothetical protein
MSSELADVTIRYTQDGSVPGPDHGEDYTGPIQITTTAMVRIALILDGKVVTKKASDGSILPIIHTHSYIFPKDVLHQGDLRPSGSYVFWTTEMDPEIVDDPKWSTHAEEALTDIPSVTVVTDPALLFGPTGIHRGDRLEQEIEVETSLELIYPEKYQQLGFAGFQVDCGIKIQGGGGRWDEGHYDHKQSFGLRFRSKYGYSSLRYPVFESAPLNADNAVAKFDKLILRAGHNKSYGAAYDPLHTAYTRDQLGRDLQIDASGRGVHGTFVHLYLNGQYWGLYNLTERPDDAFAATYFSGDEEDFYVGKHKGGDVDGDPARYRHWKDSVGKGCDFAELEEYLDVDAYIDMSLINVYAATGDFPQYYFTVSNTPPGRVYFWNWDMEDAFGGGSPRTSANPGIDRFGLIYNFDAMYNNMAPFRERFKARATKHTGPGGALTDEHVAEQWRILNDFIRLAMIGECARWGDERIADTNTRFTPDHWQQAVTWVDNDIEGRGARLLSELKSNNYWR